MIELVQITVWAGTIDGTGSDVDLREVNRLLSAGAELIQILPFNAGPTDDGSGEVMYILDIADMDNAAS